MDQTSNLVTAFKHTVAEHSDRVAVACHQRTLTYKELDRESDGLAAAIMQKVGYGNRVAMLMGHSAEMVTAILATLKSGNIYVPLDPSYPSERNQLILSDCSPALLLCDDGHLELGLDLASGTNGKTSVIDLQAIDSTANGDMDGANIQAVEMAYIMYTSGSTGKPKGVVQTHGNILHFVRDLSEQLQIGPDDNLALLTSYSHTVSAIDIFAALLSGACLDLFDARKQGNGRDLISWLRVDKISIYHSVPTLYRHWVGELSEAGVLPDLRLIILGGESVYEHDIKAYRHLFGDSCVFVNLFGSSEVFIASSHIVQQQTRIDRSLVPVGYPMTGIDMFLLNEDGLEPDVFGVGEIAYCSNFLSPGYWSQNGLDELSRVNTVLGKRPNAFLSGDSGRYLPDGTIESLGRKDHQVKIAGKRIELADVEAALDSIDQVQNSVVTAFAGNGGNTLLAAYLTTSGGQMPADKELRRLLHKKLPSSMIPVQFVHIDAFPVTPNGKVDRLALPKPSRNQAPVKDTRPQNDLQKELSRIWMAVSGIEEHSIYDSFLEVGGYSLILTQLAIKLNEFYPSKVQVQDLFDCPTIAELADLIESRIAERDEDRNLNEIEF